MAASVRRLARLSDETLHLPNQSFPLLAGSKGIFIDTLALILARGSALSAGGPRLLPNPAGYFSLPERYRMS